MSLLKNKFSLTLVPPRDGTRSVLTPPRHGGGLRRYRKPVFSSDSNLFVFKQAKGFTLLEMVIVTGIIAVMTAMVLANYPRLGSRFSLSRLAREIALSARQSQVYGLAVKEFPLLAEIYPPYGIYLRPISGGENRIVIFGDYCNPNDCETSEYQGGGDGFYNLTVGDCGSQVTECLETLLIRNEAFVYDVCVTTVNSRSCANDGSLEELHITFRRPNPEANIRKVPNDGVFYNAAHIIIGSTRSPEHKKVIRVWVTGQISVENYVEPEA